MDDVADNNCWLVPDMRGVPDVGHRCGFELIEQHAFKAGPGHLARPLVPG